MSRVAATAAGRPPRAPPWTRARALACAFVLACLPGGVAGADAAVDESELRAALVLRLARYVAWPGAAPGPPAPLRVCVVGDERVAAALARQRAAAAAVAAQSVGGDTGDLLRCDAVVFGAAPAVDVHYALARLATQPVLTIGTDDRFVRAGGMVALVARDGRVGFVANPAAARRAGLTISARLLQVATVVESDSP